MSSQDATQKAVQDIVEGEIDLKHLFLVLWKSRWAIIVTFFFAVVVAVFYTLNLRYVYKGEMHPFEHHQAVTVHRVSLPSHQSGIIGKLEAFYIYFKADIYLIKQKQCDLVSGKRSRLFRTFLSALVAKSKKLPRYFDMRDIFVDTIKGVLSPEILWFMKSLLSLEEKFFLSKTKHINLVSKGSKSYFEKRYPMPDYSYFTNGSDSEVLNVSELLKKTKNIQAITLFYAGNIDGEQCLQSSILASAKFAGEKYHLKTIGVGDNIVQLEKAFRGISNNVLVLPVLRKELVKEYLATDILSLYLRDYPADFLNKRLSNCEVLTPNEAEQGFKALLTLYINNMERPEFTQKFARTNIIKEMSIFITATGRA